MEHVVILRVFAVERRVMTADLLQDVGIPAAALKHGADSLTELQTNAIAMVTRECSARQ